MARDTSAQRLQRCECGAIFALIIWATFSVLAIATEFSGYLNTEFDIDIPLPSLPDPLAWTGSALCLKEGLNVGSGDSPLISFHVNTTVSPEDRGVRQISGVILEVLAFFALFLSIYLAYQTGLRAADVEVKNGEIVPRKQGTFCPNLMSFVLLFLGIGFAVATIFTVLLNKIKIELHIDINDINLLLSDDELHIDTTTTVQVDQIYGFTPKAGLIFEILAFIFLFNGVFFAYLAGFREAMNQAVRDGAGMDKHALNNPYMEMAQMGSKDPGSVPFIPPVKRHI
jgi:hypothetical protein